MIWSIVVSLCLVISGSCQSDYEIQSQDGSEGNRIFGFGRGKRGGGIRGIFDRFRGRLPGGSRHGHGHGHGGHGGHGHGGGSYSSEEHYYRDYQEPLDLGQLRTGDSDYSSMVV